MYAEKAILGQTGKPGGANAATKLYWQRFSVPYEYPVAFTRHLFAPENPLLAEVVALHGRTGDESISP